MLSNLRGSPIRLDKEIFLISLKLISFSASLQSYKKTPLLQRG